MKISEKAIEKQILTWLRANRIFSTKIDNVGIYDAKKGVYRKQQGSFRLKGISDIYCLHKGKSIWIEVKSETGRLSPDQKEFLTFVTLNGGLALVARSVEEVAKFFHSLD